MYYKIIYLVFHHSSALGISRTVGKPSGPELTDLMSDCEKPTVSIDRSEPETFIA